jgi:hypothetical protein
VGVPWWISTRTESVNSASSGSTCGASPRFTAAVRAVSNFTIARS